MENRHIDVLIAETVLHLRRMGRCLLGDPDCPGQFAPAPGQFGCLPFYSKSNEAVWVVENAIALQDRCDDYICALKDQLQIPTTVDFSNAELWTFLKASPRQRCLAALVAFGIDLDSPPGWKPGRKRVNFFKEE